MTKNIPELSAPIFIGGDGRSGTTLLSVILDSHPNLAIGPELHFKGPPNLGEYMLDGISLLRNGDPRVTSKGIKAHPEYGPVYRFTTRCKRFGIDLEELETLIVRISKEYDLELETFQERCVLIDALGRLKASKNQKQKWGMKIMRDIKQFPRYSCVWPNAKFIHIIRDGRDAASSQLREHSSWGYKNITEAAEKWARMMQLSSKYTTANNYIEVKYEDLITNSKRTLENLLDFLEIPWNEKVLSHHQEQHSMFENGAGHPSHAAIKRPLSASAIGRYRRDLSPEETTAFESIARGELERHNYFIAENEFRPSSEQESIAKRLRESRSFKCSGIIIGSDGRSGSTLLSHMLNRHSKIKAFPEIHFHLPSDLGLPVQTLLDQLILTPEYYRSEELRRDNDVKKTFQFIVRCRRAGLSLAELKEICSYGLEVIGPEIMEYKDRLKFVDLIVKYLACRENCRFWSLKIMKQMRRLPEYLMEWPDAVPVHIVRDGRDVATSQVEDFEWGYCSYPEAALEWSSFVQCVRELGTAIDICELTYEALVNDTQSTLQVLLNRLDLEWEDSIRNPSTTGLEHSAYFHGDVSHPSQQKVEGNIYTSAIGRYKDVMTEDIHNNFVRLAKDSLELHGYLHLPVVSIFAHRGPTPCNNLEACTKRSSSLLKSLVPRYISENWPTPNQVKTAILPLHFESYEDYCSSIKKIYKSQRVRDAKKAAEKGYFCQQFDRRLFVPDIVEINQSKERRSGGAMKESYLKSVDEMGGEPNQHFTLDAPACPAHYDSWWGAFLNEEGYKQGKILTGKQLCAYVNLRRNGNLAMYNLIIGHGRHLEYGVMPLLHLEIMNWILEQGNIYSQGLQYLGYAGYYQGGDGLRRWKKSFGFEPMYMRVGPW